MQALQAPCGQGFDKDDGGDDQQTADIAEAANALAKEGGAEQSGEERLGR